MRCHHFCNTLACPHCTRRFWRWAENHTRRSDFYVRAAQKHEGPGSSRHPGPNTPEGV